MADQDHFEAIRIQVAQTIRRLLSEQDRDPYSLTAGCFDRRYWAWKLVDLPDATLQCNLYPLALLYADPQSGFYRSDVLRESIVSGLRYTGCIQHRDGSFDQAFPYERSFGATAFLLQALLEAVTLVGAELDEKTHLHCEHALRRSADFLCQHGESHGQIANHLAGAALGLLLAGEHFKETRYRDRSGAILKKILAEQSPEGWFQEYEGADPGYQTLSLFYLARLYKRMPSEALRDALDRAIRFLAYFVHPDGTFGGEYGSRRTAVFYPGGLSLMSGEFPLATALVRAMSRSIAAGSTVTLWDVDMGNVAPLLSNYVLTLQTAVPACDDGMPPLPWQCMSVNHDFPQAGIYVRGTKGYYAVFGVSAGGVLKVFDKNGRSNIWDDGGYMGELSDRSLVTTQATVRDRLCQIEESEVRVTSAFYRALRATPTPFKFLLLRALNLTCLRSAWANNLVKRSLVHMLITAKRQCAMQLHRRVRFEEDQVIVEDEITKSPRLKITRLECGRKFVGIHMATTRYFEGVQMSRRSAAPTLDVGSLNQTHRLAIRFVIRSSHA